MSKRIHWGGIPYAEQKWTKATKWYTVHTPLAGWTHQRHGKYWRGTSQHHFTGYTKGYTTSLTKNFQPYLERKLETDKEKHLTGDNHSIWYHVRWRNHK